MIPPSTVTTAASAATSNAGVLFDGTLILSTLCCSLTFGFTLLFSIVIMPGIASLGSDAGFLRAFQAIDGIIQNSQPIFVMVWMGSLLFPLVAMTLTCCSGSGGRPSSNIPQEQQDDKCTMIIWPKPIPMAIVTLLIVMAHVITFTKHIPRNNRLHKMDIDSLLNTDEGLQVLADERQYFEDPWNLWNNIRTVLFGLGTVYFVMLLSKLSLAPFGGALLVASQTGANSVTDNTNTDEKGVFFDNSIESSKTNYQSII